MHLKSSSSNLTLGAVQLFPLFTSATPLPNSGFCYPQTLICSLPLCVTRLPTLPAFSVLTAFSSVSPSPSRKGNRFCKSSCSSCLLMGKQATKKRNMKKKYSYSFSSHFFIDSKLLALKVLHWKKLYLTAIYALTFCECVSWWLENDPGKPNPVCSTLTNSYYCMSGKCRKR